VDVNAINGLMRFSSRWITKSGSIHISCILICNYIHNNIIKLSIISSICIFIMEQSLNSNYIHSMTGVRGGRNTMYMVQTSDVL
jgi:hypothetical protein